MGTRGIIAKPEGDGWAGRYHHWDSYPSGLGATLIGLHAGHFAGDVDAMIEYLVDGEPVGWSTINGADWSLPKGWHDRHERPKGPQSYSARGETGDHWHRSTDADASGAEWCYVLTKAGVMGAFGMGGGNWRNPVLVSWGDLPAMLEVEKVAYAR